MARYKKPRRINAVSVFFILALGAAAYWAVLFGPHHWRKWRAQEVLGEVANRYYARRADDMESMDSLRQQAINGMRSAGVTAAVIKVDMHRDADGGVRVTADYVEIVRHPLIGKTTTLQFHAQATVKGGRAF